MLETTRPLRCSPLCLGDRGPGTGTVSVTSHIQTHCPPTRPLPFLAGSHGTHFSWYPPQGLRVPCRINRIVSLPTENPSEAPQGPQARSKLLSDMRPVPAAAQAPCCPEGNQTRASYRLSPALLSTAPSALPSSASLPACFPSGFLSGSPASRKPSWSFQSTENPEDTHRAGQGRWARCAALSLTDRSWLQPPGGRASSCPQTHRGRICTCGPHPRW